MHIQVKGSRRFETAKKEAHRIVVDKLEKAEGRYRAYQEEENERNSRDVRDNRKNLRDMIKIYKKSDDVIFRSALGKEILSLRRSLYS
tara:strand:+ start:1095 stop:1358 length:264 start_codon:yes stop_codon:yes gene_type:complete